MIKNKICGDLDICGLGAAQLTDSGRIADSAKIARNASTIIMMGDKTPEEIQEDGQECGSKKFRVVLNRNGPQMGRGEYIDVGFDGDTVTFYDCKQHIPQTPY